MSYLISLSKFESIRPPYETAQEQTLEWLVDAHVEAQAKYKGREEMELFRENLRAKLWHVGCKPVGNKQEGIRRRGHVLSDYLHRDWKAMQVYCLEEHPSGSNLGERTNIFERHVDQVFEQFYPVDENPPDQIIHVTCTGYVSPSGAQKIVSLRRWNECATVTHAYHMGCYGSIPALRMARGFLMAQGGRADIVHTEICSLHVNPLLHTPDQLVSQSLFADGFIKYSAQAQAEIPSLSCIAIHEEIIPETTGAMIWKAGNWGFEMWIAKEIPVLIARALDNYLCHLCQKANRFPEKIMTEAIFAVHPGGPKILQYVQKHFSLREEQIKHSLMVFRECGNMSSATLPHIWKAIVEDDEIPNGMPVLSLAFGPGLTICGTVMEKCGGSR